MLPGLWLTIRAVAMTLLFPGVVAGYLPWLLLRREDAASISTVGAPEIAGGILVVLGALILLRCIWEFAWVGRGTLAPFDETRTLVVSGLYRYVRNPMYVGVLLVLTGEALAFGSLRLLAYTGVVFLFFNLFVIGYEESRLRHKYGEEYREYCRQVGRWIPRSAGWRP